MGGFNHQGHALNGDFGIPVFSQVFLFLSHHKVGRFAQHQLLDDMLPALTGGLKAKLWLKLRLSSLLAGLPQCFVAWTNSWLTHRFLYALTQWRSATQLSFRTRNIWRLIRATYFYISFTFPYYFMWRAKEGERHMHATCAVRRQHGSWSSPSAVWILGIKLGSSGLLASACTHWAIGLARFPQFLINSCLSFNMSPLGSYTLLWAQCAEDRGFLADYPTCPYCQANHPERKRQCLVAPGLTLGLASEALSLQF